MFKNLSREQLRSLVFLLAKAELRGFTVFRKYPLYGSFLQDIDVYAECVNEREVIKRVFIDCQKTDWMTPELMDVELTYRDDLVKKGFMDKQKDVFWVVTNTRFDVSCLPYTRIPNLELKDSDWILRSIRRYFSHYKQLRVLVQTFQAAKLLPDPL